MCALALHNPSVFSAHAARDIVSSVPFQKIIYYNSMYSAVWWVLTVVLLLHQYMRNLRVKDPDEVRTIFFAFFTIFEPLRLSAAYHGNLLEKAEACTAVAGSVFQVPYIFISIVITVVPLAPACAYFLAGQKDLTPMRRALQVPQMLFLLAFLFTGVLALRKIYKYSKLQQAFVLDAVAGAGRQADLDQAPSLTVASTGVVRRTAMQQSAR